MPCLLMHVYFIFPPKQPQLGKKVFHCTSKVKRILWRSLYLTIAWRYDRERDTTLFSFLDFFLDFLFFLTLSRRRPLSYRNYLLRKSMDWFLYDNGLRLERVKYYWIANNLKPRHVSDFVINCFRNCRGKRSKKTWFWDNFLYF